MRYSSVCLLFAPLFALVLVASAAKAQESEFELELIPKGGVYYQAYHFKAADQGLYTYRFQPALTYGVQVGYKFHDSPYGLRVGVLLTQSMLHGKPLVNIGGGDEKNRIFIASVDWLYWFRDATDFRPFVALGAGVKHHEMNARIGLADFIERFTDSQVQPSFLLGGGVEWHLGRVAIRGELASHPSRFDVAQEGGKGRWLFDMVASLGIRLVTPDPEG